MCDRDVWKSARKHGELPDGRVLIAVRANVPEDKMFLVKVRRPRSVKHHRLYWGMLREVVKATGYWTSPESLHKWIKYRLGLYTITAVDSGHVIIEWDSTDFYAMDQSRFEDFFANAVAEILMKTGVDPLDFKHIYDKEGEL